MARYRLEHKDDGHLVIAEFDAVTLDEMLEFYGMFLKGCGFSYDGELVIEEDECLSEEQ